VFINRRVFHVEANHMLRMNDRFYLHESANQTERDDGLILLPTVMGRRRWTSRQVRSDEENDSDSDSDSDSDPDPISFPSPPPSLSPIIRDTNTRRQLGNDDDVSDTNLTNAIGVLSDLMAEGQRFLCTPTATSPSPPRAPPRTLPLFASTINSLSPSPPRAPPRTLPLFASTPFNPRAAFRNSSTARDSIVRIRREIYGGNGSIGRSSSSSNASAGDSDSDNDSFSFELDIGNGSENGGANVATINSLPYFTIVDVERELPPDHRNCSICLEDFCVGEARKTLPCMHGFHKECVDQWLGTNGCCPICKHRI